MTIIFTVDWWIIVLLNIKRLLQADYRLGYQSSFCLMECLPHIIEKRIKPRCLINTSHSNKTRRNCDEATSADIYLELARKRIKLLNRNLKADMKLSYSHKTQSRFQKGKMKECSRFIFQEVSWEIMQTKINFQQKTESEQT